MSDHKCHIPGCSIKVHPTMLMCLPHWDKVPNEIKIEIRKEFNPDQCRGLVRPSRKWLKAARAAINHVRDSESDTRCHKKKE